MKIKTTSDSFQKTHYVISLYRSSFVARSCIRVFLLWLLVSLFPVTGCQTGSSAKWDRVRQKIRSEFPTVRHISTDTLYSWLNNPESVKPVLIDRREPGEYAVSHLQGALPAKNEEEALDIIVRAGNRPVVVYCSVGYRSSALVNILQKRGVSEVYNLEGSIFQWANEGKEIYRGNKKVNVVHPYNSTWKRLLDKDLWYPGK